MSASCGIEEATADPSADGLHLAVWQGCSHVDGSGESVRANIGIIEASARQARARGADILVFPEMFITGYDLPTETLHSLAQPADGPIAQHIKSICAELAITIIYGFPEIDNENGGCLYNSVNAIAPNGQRLLTYRKTHLWGPEKNKFSPGASLLEPIRVSTRRGTWRVGVLICYDMEFPEPVRWLALQGAELIVCPTANMEPYGVINRRVVQVRALENRIYIAYVNHSGREGSLDFVGETIVVGPSGDDLLHMTKDASGLEVVTFPRIAEFDKSAGEYLFDRRPELYSGILCTGAVSTKRLLIINGVTGALGNAVLTAAVQHRDAVVYGMTRQGLPVEEQFVPGGNKLPTRTLTVSIGPHINEQSAIAGFVRAIDFEQFDRVDYVHAVGVMPFDVNDAGKHFVENDTDGDGINDLCMALTPHAFLGMVDALAASSDKPITALVFGALSDMWNPSAHHSWIRSIEALKDGLKKRLQVNSSLAGVVLNISSVSCAHELLVRPYLCANTNPDLTKYMSPDDCARRALQLVAEAHRGKFVEVDFYRPVAHFVPEVYYEDANFTRQKVKELYPLKKNEIVSSGTEAIGTASDVSAYYSSPLVMENYQRLWGDGNMHIGLFPQAESPPGPVLTMPEAATRLCVRMATLMELTADSTLLDLGCGYGASIRDMVALTGCSGVGLDITPCVIEKARSDLPDAKPYAGRLKFYEGSFCNFPQAVASLRFSHVMDIQAILYGYDKLPDILKQTKSVLKPGGKICFSEFIGDGGPLSEDMRRYYDRVQLATLCTSEGLRQAVEAEGFRVVTMEDTSCHMLTGFKMLAKKAHDEGRLSPDGTSLADGYNLTAKLFSSGSLKSCILLAVLQ